MNHLRSLPIFLIVVALGLLVFAVPEASAQAPATLENGYRNIFGGPAPGIPGGVAAPVPGIAGTPEQKLFEAYQAQGRSGTAFGGFPTRGYGSLSPGITPFPLTQTSVPVPPASAIPQNFPRSSATTEIPVIVEMRSAIVGRPLALFAVSYNFGSEIPPPEKINTVTGQPFANFYRAEPLNARLKTTVDVTGGVATTTTVDATASDIDGVTTSTIGSTFRTVTIGLNPQFYWSKHAGKVYASQPGTIVIKWRESANVTSRSETYVIASSPAQPERTIYWTENGYKGPPVEVPEGRVNQMNIIYNTLVPKDVVSPASPWLEGLVDYAEQDPAKKRYKTFYYETNLLHAYNVQGRVFVEYLGNPRADGTSEPKGIEIVNIVKEAIPLSSSVDLGEEVTHKPFSNEPGMPSSLEPKILAGLGLSGQPYLHQQVSVGGAVSLYAIRETQPNVRNDAKTIDNTVLVYWLETAKLGLKWPKQYIGYVQQWPVDTAKYSVYARPDSGTASGLENALATAVQLDSSNNPALVYQDDPANAQAVLAPGNKFHTLITQAAPTNRALLRFTRDGDIWFERVFSQLDPYYLDPVGLLGRTVTGGPNESGEIATGFENILNVLVVDPATGTTLIEGVDYTVDSATGIVRLIEKRYINSVANLGSFNISDTLSVRLFGGWDGIQDQPGIDWEVRNLSLKTTGAANPFAAVNFANGSAGFSVESNGPPAGPWSYDAPSGVWRAAGSATISDSSLFSPSFTVAQTGVVTLTLKHRYQFENQWDGGLIQFSVNGGGWQTVPDTAFTANPYSAIINQESAPYGGVLNTGTQKAFTGISQGYNTVQSITSVEITFIAPTLPFSTVPAVVAANIGTRIEPNLGLGANTYGETAPVYVGYIQQASGTAFNVGAYKDPFVAGFDEAAKGAIIGVNALAGNNQLEVWWYKKSQPKGAVISGTYWPSFVQKYNLGWPAATDEINLASNVGSDDLPSLEATGNIYTQNNPATAGYNPNEEHAVMINGRAWALRDDLNVATSSQPYVLLNHTGADQRPSMRVFRVIRGDFTYSAVAGKVLQAPMPLPLLPAPLKPDGILASYEMPGVPDFLTVSNNLGNSDSAFAHYQKFTWTDRKGTLWTYRGPHNENQATPPTLIMRYFYATLPGFDFPGLSTQPPVGTITPYLRRGTAGAYQGNAVTGVIPGAPSTERAEQPMDVTYLPQWPDSAPELRVGETLTLPKLGLPQVRGQQSAEFIYQQSVAQGTGLMADRQKSARLFDPTRAKIYPLGGPASPAAQKNNLPAIPLSVNTSRYLGKVYFPNLPPHLSSRLYFDPAIGTYGAIVFKGTFMNELVGEKYLQLNVMSAADRAAAKELTPAGDDKAKWDAAIDGLVTTMETFVEDPGKKGTYIPLRDEAATPRRPIVIDGIDRNIQIGAAPPVATAPAGTVPGSTQRSPVLPDQLAEVFYSDTAVDSYAVSASGGGKGFVVLAMGNGEDTDFTSKDGPVALQVFKINAPLYRGELKVINSQNPLDEKLTLQHTGDFAGHPEEYDFEWRYAPPADGLPLKLYSYTRKLILPGNNEPWSLLHNPVSNPLESGSDYKKFRSPTANASALPVVFPQGEITINDGNGTPGVHGTTLPYALIRRTFSADKRPLRLFLSLEVGANDGAVVYLNDAPVASWHSPTFEDSPTTSTPATAPAFDPLPLVFEIDANALVANATPNNNVFTVELYTTADAASTTKFNLRLEGSEEVENLIGWLPVLGPDDTPSTVSSTNNAATPPTTGIVSVQGKNRHTIQGTSILTLSDNYLIMRYRARDSANAAYENGGGWSKWTEPQLAEGWIKRVLAGINPFQQRVKDLFNHEANTSVSLVEQAGKRWEGDIALNLDNINDVGLIEIYETVLRRGKDLSINGTPAINYGGANDALLLAAGYLSDLYMILGNEAYADASNSTIAFSTDSAANFITQYGDVATAMFSFKGQLATVLDEELSLLRGRDDSLLPGTQKTPIYNRLIWNYTRGIDSGEAIYALNYNIKDRVWDFSLNPNNPANLPTDGVISAADAATAYPQGHGDAYGHYLTAVTGYYGLLNNPFFSWTPRIEAVLVLGTPVSVDYQDERKFAAAAAAVVRTASQTLDLTYRQEYSAKEDAGWSDLHDAKPNTNTGQVRNWGTDDWASRGGQGALFHWVTANSLLPAVDPNPSHSGIQKIDRTTVPELAEIAAQAASVQQTLDHADARLNPLGLAAGALAFDISPTEVDAGKTHYEQIYERAVSAMQNAVSAFNNAKGSTEFLRQQEDSLADQRFAIQSQEQAYTNQLIELYGSPYTDDIGPGRTYPQDYAGPDLLHPMYVEITETIGNFSSPGGQDFTIFRDLRPAEIENLTSFFTGFDEGDLPVSDSVSYTLDPISGELRKPSTWSGRRVSPGRMQTAVSDMLLARQDLFNALYDYDRLKIVMGNQIKLYNSAVTAHTDTLATNVSLSAEQTLKDILIVALDKTEAAAKAAAETFEKSGNVIKEGLPRSVGLANDVTSAGRAAALALAAVSAVAARGTEELAANLKIAAELAQSALERAAALGLSEIEWANENTQLIAGLRESLQGFIDKQGALDGALRRMDQKQRDLYALMSEGDRIQLQRLVFRQHSAAIIQGYRTRDFAFRAFRNEALERYKGLFDLSARYTYLAARAYDYETGLLDATGNSAAAGFYKKIVQARALGVVADGQPQFSGASAGDPGLSGVLAQLAGDWSVAKTRLGFNNPDRYATTFSLRGEKFRMVPGVDGDLPWKDKLSSYRMANVLDDADVKRHCMQIATANGSAVPGIVIPFSSTIATGSNFFGMPLAGGDHTFTPSSFSTKIRSSGMAFAGYVGMDSPTTTSGTLGEIGATSPATYNTGFGDPNALSATPYIYLIPVGSDSMRSPPLGDTSLVRTWAVQDQAIPLPFNIANSDYSSQPAWVSAASLSEPPFTLRKHQAFRAVPDGTNFQGGYGFTNARLIGRSAWNSQWKIVIPGNTLLNDPNLGIQTFINTVKDIKLHLETYSYSGN